MTDVDPIPTLDPDVLQRIEAAQAAGAEKSGIPWQPFSDVQQRENEAFGEAMANIAAIEVCGILDSSGEYKHLDKYDTCDQRNPDTKKLVPQGNIIVQMLASERFQGYQAACQRENDRLIDPRNAPSFDQADPFTLARLYVLTNNYERLVPLEVPFDWQTYIHQSLGRHTECEVHLLHSCYDSQVGPARHTLVYNRGEIIFAFRICMACLDALSWIKFGAPNYAGPTGVWRDNGNRDDPDNPWDD